MQALTGYVVWISKPGIRAFQQVWKANKVTTQCVSMHLLTYKTRPLALELVSARFLLWTTRDLWCLNYYITARVLGAYHPQVNRLVMTELPRRHTMLSAIVAPRRLAWIYLPLTIAHWHEIYCQISCMQVHTWASHINIRTTDWTEAITFAKCNWFKQRRNANCSA